MAVRYKALVCSSLIAGIAGLNPAKVTCSSLVARCVGSGLSDEIICSERGNA